MNCYAQDKSILPSYISWDGTCGGLYNGGDMMEEAYEMNRLALVKHFQLHEPVEAAKLHFKALDIELEYSHQLHKEVGNTKEGLLKQRQMCLAIDLIVTLIDIGNCLWSSQKNSKVAYDSALMIYRLMQIDKPVLTTSIFNRLSKLDPYMFSQTKLGIIDEVMMISKDASLDPQSTSSWPFNKSIEVTKLAIVRLQAN